MRVAIDKAGRIVVPKALRDRWGLEPGRELDVIETPDGIELQVTDDRPPAVLVEEDGVLVLDINRPGASESLDETLALRDALRNRDVS